MPLRKARWLIARHAGRVLLERRPPSGIWGGLWAFPELRDMDVRLLGRALGCDIASVRRLPPLEHGFTHFRLRVQPLLCEVRERVPHAGQAGRLWIPVDEAADSAVPAPVRNLLRDLAAGS